MYSFETTAYAVELQEKIARSGRGLHIRLTADEAAKRVEVVKLLKNSPAAEGKTNFQGMFNYLLPIWRDEIVHGPWGESFTSWFGGRDYIIYSLNSGAIADVLQYWDKFFLAISGEEEEEVDRWLSRLNQIPEMDHPWHGWYQWLNPAFYAETYPVEDAVHLFNTTQLYLPTFLRALKAGFSVSTIKKTNVGVWTLFTPEFVENMLLMVRPMVLKQIASLDTPGRPKITEDIAYRLIEVGFTKAAEVRAYAKKFGIGWTDENFYVRVSAAKEQYPVLEDYTPAV